VTQFPTIHGLKDVTRAKPAGNPAWQPAAAPKDTTPTCHLPVAALVIVNGPPESPLHVPRPPAVVMQIVLPTTTEVP